MFCRARGQDGGAASSTPEFGPDVNATTKKSATSESTAHPVVTEYLQALEVKAEALVADYKTAYTNRCSIDKKLCESASTFGKHTHMAGKQCFELTTATCGATCGVRKRRNNREDPHLSRPCPCPCPCPCGARRVALT